MPGSGGVVRRGRGYGISVWFDGATEAKRVEDPENRNGVRLRSDDGEVVVYRERTHRGVITARLLEYLLHRVVERERSDAITLHHALLASNKINVLAFVVDEERRWGGVPSSTVCMRVLRVAAMSPRLVR